MKGGRLGGRKRKEDGGRGGRPAGRFTVRGGADCAYLGDADVQTASCASEKHWICARPPA